MGVGDGVEAEGAGVQGTKMGGGRGDGPGGQGDVKVLLMDGGELREEV